MSSKSFANSMVKLYVAGQKRRDSEVFLQNLKENASTIEGETEEIYLEDLNFDKITNRLTFKVIRAVTKPKIVKYITRNYVKYPVYEGYTTRTAVLKKFGRKINPLRFVSEEILDLDLNKEFIIQIIDEIGIVPKWREKEISLEALQNKIDIEKSKLREINDEKLSYDLKPNNYPTIPSNFWLRFLFGFVTFFLSFVGFLSKKDAEANDRLNKKNKAWNEEHIKKIDATNALLKIEIDNSNHNIKAKIDSLLDEFKTINHAEIELVDKDEEWIDLRQACHFAYDELADLKGVYIIWNKSKNKYYVGQSKNMKKRLSQHFCNGDVNNVVFAKDWYQDDEFFYKYYVCDTKDELDAMEMAFIEEYNSFEKGYNKTKGNK